MHDHSRITAFVFAAIVTASPTFAQSAKPKPGAKPPVKGQAQLTGGNGQFGTVYSLQNGFNFEILSAHYSLEPFIAYETLTAKTDEKLVVLDIAIKNAQKGDEFFNSEGLFTLVDDKGQLYTGGDVGLASKGAQSWESTLRPGQGLGQPALHDPLRFGIAVPAKARIVKIMLNHGRLGTSEKVVRYYVAGATKSDAGEPGDPKNVIAPLPSEARDAADSLGAVALDAGKGAAGTYEPSGSFALRFDGITYTTDPVFGGNAPDEGKKYAVLTVTAKNLTEKQIGMFDVEGGDNPLYEITDSDGEKAKPIGYRKAKRDEDPEHDFAKGDEYTFRVFFTLPKDATAKKVVLGTLQSRKWEYDVSATK